MALTEETVNDKIEVITVGTYKTLQVRKATIIKKNDVEISRTFFRHTVYPNADLTLEDDDVETIGTAVFTQAVKDAYAATLTTE